MTVIQRLRGDRAENSIMQTITIAVSAILIAAGLITAPGLINNARDNNARGDLANIAYAQEVLMADDGTYSDKVNKSDADVDGWYLGSQTNIKYTLSNDVDSSALVCNDPDWAYLLKSKSASGNTFFRSSSGTATSQDVATISIPSCIAALAGYTDFIDTDFVSPVVMDLNNIAIAEEFAFGQEARYYSNVAPGESDSLFDLVAGVAGVEYELSEAVSDHSAIVCDAPSPAYLIRAKADSGINVFRGSEVDLVSTDAETLALPGCITSNASYSNFVSNAPTAEPSDYLKFQQVIASRGAKIALDESGHIWTWGSAAALGDGSTTDRYIPEMIASDKTFKGVYVGAHTTFAIDSSDHLWAWGSNTNGTIGDGSRTNKATITPVSHGQTFKTVANAATFTVALDTDGKLWAWGRSANGISGSYGTTVERLTPTAIEPTMTFNDIAVGQFHALAIRDDGRLMSWGDNQFGQLGTTNNTSRSRPMLSSLPSNLTFTSIAAGARNSFAIDSNNKLWSFGAHTDYAGVLGGASSIVTPVSNVLFKDVSASRDHAIALAVNNDVYTWGLNPSGQLGTGDTADRATPTNIGNLGVASIGNMGNSYLAFSVAIDTNGEVLQWGDKSAIVSTPSEVPGSVFNPTKIRVPNE